MTSPIDTSRAVKEAAAEKSRIDRSVLLETDDIWAFAAELLEPASFTPRLERWWFDPVGFIETFFPTFKWTPYQKEIVSRLIEREKLCIRGPHGLGKTALVSLVVLWFAITRDDMCKSRGGDWKVITTASVERQLTKFLWPEIRKWARPKGIAWEALGREPFDRRAELLFTQLKLEYGEAFAANSDDPANIEGAHADHLLYIVDEGKSVIPETYDAIEGAFSGAGKSLAPASPDVVLPANEVEKATQELGETALQEAFSNPEVAGGISIAPASNGTDESVGGSESGAAHQDGPAESNESTPAREAYALVISTPGEPAGRFYEIQARRPGYEDWWVRWVNVEEAIAAGRITKEWVERRKRQWGESSAMFQNRVLGQFAVDALDGVIPIAWAEAAMLRGTAGSGLVEGDFKGRLAAISCDVARTGVDKTILAMRCGATCLPLIAFHQADTMQTTGEILRYIDAYGTRVSSFAVIDVIGVGAGVVDRLRELGIDVEAFNAASSGLNFTDASGEIEFLNRRAAAWWGLRELLDPAGAEDRAKRGIPELVLPMDEELLGDLCTPRYRRTSAGKIAVEEKDQIRKRLGRSPDRGDAVVMAYADRVPEEIDQVVVYDEPVRISPY